MHKALGSTSSSTTITSILWYWHRLYLSWSKSVVSDWCFNSEVCCDHELDNQILLTCRGSPGARGMAGGRTQLIHYLGDLGARLFGFRYTSTGRCGSLRFSDIFIGSLFNSDISWDTWWALDQFCRLLWDFQEVAPGTRVLSAGSCFGELHSGDTRRGFKK